MYVLLIGVFGLLNVLLIIVILMQQPKSSGGLGMAFGGGMESMLGVRGAPTFFTKLTAVSGGVYMVLSLVLSLMVSPSQARKTAIESEVESGTLMNRLQPLVPEQPQSGQPGGQTAPVGKGGNQ